MPAPKDPVKYQEWKRKLSESKKGKPFHCKNPEERAKKISNALKGKPKPWIRENRNPIKKPEVKAKQIEGIRKYIKEHPEIRKLRSERIKGEKNPMYGMKGNKNPATRPEVKKKKSELQKGKPHPHKGTPRSPETRKKISLARIGKYTKEKHPNWKGGKSFEPYPLCWTKELRQAIRQRDNFTCQVCGKYPAFEVHHIDYNKESCEPDNLITLCKNCHSKTNFKREYWKIYFQNLMKDKKENNDSQ